MSVVPARSMGRLACVVVVVSGLVALVGWLSRSEISALLFQPTASAVPVVALPGVDEGRIETVAEGLRTPWSIAFLPDDTLLVVEREGQLARIGGDGGSVTVAGVAETAEGGLLGVALHPDFTVNRWLYLYSTTRADAGLSNRVERYRYDGGSLSERRVMIEGIAAAQVHDGGAVAFGPDGKLYVTTGDANVPDAAQDTASLSGKILRLNDDGSVPADNPFGTAVWSYGHRNPQGVTWDDQGRMWATEHGPSGAETGNDEVNLIERGANYGWPVIRGTTRRAGMRAPVATSGNDDTWAPGGIAYAGGALYFSGLRGQTLYRATIGADAGLTLARLFDGTYGRLRAVAAGDGALYVSTSNTDGRGSPRAGDDRVLRLPLSVLSAGE